LTKFLELGLSKPIANALKDFGYTEPTEIQQATIPIVLSGQDLLASAKTGSGKTAAFALPVLECLEEPDKKPRALVLVPTRELALQVEEQFEIFGRYSKLRTVTLYGGTGYDAQQRALKKGVDIIVATPGRLLDFMDRGCADVSKIEMLILDEADRLLDMGFMPQIRRIICKLSKERQTLMFSATIDDRVQRIASEYLIDPETVRVKSAEQPPSEIEQRMYAVTEFGKDALLAKLIREQNMTSVLVFTKTRRRAAWVKDRLREENIAAEEIHGDISQAQRERTLAGYREGLFSVLVATDVAARGLDISSISHVVNYDLPEAPEDYVHRIGRTGRAGRSGVALSFVCDEQKHLVRDIEKITGRVLDPDADKKAAVTRRLRPLARRRRIV
jgi:superfamily II DNA/RNA helicase